jgi:hypothetical protein
VEFRPGWGGRLDDVLQHQLLDRLAGNLPFGRQAIRQLATDHAGAADD